MIIDIEKLTADLEQEYLGAYFGGGFGAALVELGDLKNATPEQVIEYAERMNINLTDYEIN